MNAYILIGCSCLSAGIGGIGAVAAISAYREEKLRRQRFAERVISSGVDGRGLSCTGAASRVIGFARTASRLDSSVRLPPLLQCMVRTGSSNLMGFARTAGLESSVTADGLCRARVRLAIGLCLMGALIGAVGSNQMAIALGVVGAVVGWGCVRWALRQETSARSMGLERHLSEVIEVVCLGLRSGLSFDRALNLYCDCFGGVLSSELDLAQRQWFAGLRTREDALRNLAGTYDSPLFARMVDSIVRSMRFGSPLADSLDVLAVEARQVHKARVQEKVMKAPVKMMVPVGTLILPSMLILVLGPVLLDLVGNF